MGPGDPVARCHGPFVLGDQDRDRRDEAPPLDVPDRDQRRGVVPLADPAQTAAKAEIVSKADAARAALKEGIEGPQEAVAFIRKRFGIEMAPQHFSAVKSQIKSARAAARRRANRGGSRNRPRNRRPRATLPRRRNNVPAVRWT